MEMNLKELREIAERATPGKRKATYLEHQQPPFNASIWLEDMTAPIATGGVYRRIEDVIFSETFDQPTVLRLIELAEAARYYQRKLRHIHRAGNVGDLDRCATCGLDIRDPIHQRAEQEDG